MKALLAIWIFFVTSAFCAQLDFKSLEFELNDKERAIAVIDGTDMEAVEKKKKELLVLRKKLEGIRKKIEEDTVELTAFKIKLKAAFDEKGKKKASTIFFRQGEILEFSADIKYPEHEGEVTTVLQWQLFDPKGNASENYFKENELNLVNTSDTQVFKIKLGQDLKLGTYKVALTHFLKKEASITYQAVKSFELKQEIEISSLQFFRSPTDILNRTTFYDDENPHLYVNFKLSPTIEKVNVYLMASDQKGNVLYTHEGERQRKGDSQRAGIKISDLQLGDTVTFSALIRGEDGYEISRSKSFKVIKKIPIRPSRPVIVFDIPEKKPSKPRTYAKEPSKSKTYSQKKKVVKKGLSRAEKIRLGERAYSKLFKVFFATKMPKSVATSGLYKAAMDGCSDAAKIDYANAIGRSQIAAKRFGYVEIAKLAKAMVEGMKVIGYSEANIRILAKWHKIDFRVYRDEYESSMLGFNVVHNSKVLSLRGFAGKLVWQDIDRTKVKHYDHAGYKLIMDQGLWK